VLLGLWTVLSTAGLVTFVVGHLLGMHAVASIGAVMTMLTGLNVAVEGLEMKDGEQIEREFTTVNNQTVANSTAVNDTYRTHSWTEEFAHENAVGLGVFQLLIGLAFFYRQMEERSEE